MIKLYEGLRVLLFPVLRFLLPLISQTAKRRIDFELCNLVEVNRLKRAEYGFEISSEGEFQQVLFLIEYLLEKQKTIEIIYCSESVEYKIKTLTKKYSEQVRTLRMPLLTYKPWVQRQNVYKWLTCHTLFMCRYDFFPELIFYGKNKAKNFYLLSASSKNFISKSGVSKQYLKYCYKSFHRIVSATNEDFERFIEYKIIDKEKSFCADLRSLQILERLKVAETKLSQEFPVFNQFQKKVLDKSKSSCLFGSFWSYEAPIFAGVGPEDLFETSYCLAPHKLDKSHLLDIIHELSKYQLAVYILTKETTNQQLLSLIAEYRENPGIWLFDVRGVLCEMYSQFDCAYIGGGFGESVHSVLEPFLAGCGTVCGPKTQRSSEYDYAYNIDPNNISTAHSYNEVLPNLKKYSDSKRENTVVNIPFKIDELLDFLNLNLRGDDGASEKLS